MVKTRLPGLFRCFLKNTSRKGQKPTQMTGSHIASINARVFIPLIKAVIASVDRLHTSAITTAGIATKDG